LKERSNMNSFTYQFIFNKIDKVSSNLIPIYNTPKTINHNSRSAP